MSASSTDPALDAACENCGAPLAGPYCARCGQSRHNPMRHFGHAVEDFFESFWHLDGRVFRTLRDLLVPGKVAEAYIAGHRVRYVAPLRLFLVLSVLTFFVAQSVVHFGPNTVNIGFDEAAAQAAPAFADAATVAEVERRRDAELAELRRVRDASGNAFLAMGLDRAIEVIERGAEGRIRQIRANPQAAVALRDAPKREVQPTRENPMALDRGGKAWHERDNPYVIDGWPRLTRWTNAQIGVAQRNLLRIQDDPDLLKAAVMRSVPAALLMLLPVFALLLKLAYVRQRRGYLEHLVVGLYSHTFACIVVLCVSVLTLLQNAAGAGVLDTLLGLLKVALWTWLPVYLLLMQKRVYGQGWLRTGAKFAVLGLVYAAMVVMALGPLMVLGVLRA